MKNKVNKEKAYSVITKLCIVLIICAIGVCLYTSIELPESATLNISIIVVLALSLIIAYLFSPKTIELNDTALTLHRVAGKIRIPLENIKEVRPYYQSGIRLFGSGGLFGNFGVFTNHDIGRHYEYVGDFSEAFLVVLKSGRKYVFSCENSNKVIEQITQQYPALKK